MLVRKYRYPTLTENNHKLGNITTNLHRITPSEGYKNDMRTYLRRYNTLRGNEGRYVRSWVNMYLKLMRDLARRDKSIDLLTLTREEIYTHNLPCISIKKAVEAGLLPVGYDYNNRDREI
ncbi:MAG: hypothetical protein M0P99_01390 [Candidatus Cloacimonetes bacterium]|nr:hypothetical protein [Candidatus Cloacimonadota bacterium]